MPWVKFNFDFDWPINPSALISYKAGHRYLVSQACADAAIAVDKAVADVRPQEAQARRRSPRVEDAGR